jgi:RNA polymerase sigma factor (sigma-70 family)
VGISSKQQVRLDQRSARSAGDAPASISSPPLVPAPRGPSGQQSVQISEIVVADLVERAAGGDERAWSELVRRYTGLLWSVTRSFGLPEHRAADVVQTTWLRLVQHIGDLRNPDGIGSWLATTARREALRAIAKGRREELTDGEQFDEQPDQWLEPVDEDVLRAEQQARVRAALAKLPERHQLLLRLLAADPPVPYRDIAAALDMPIGSIGPTRARVLERLRVLLVSEVEPV